MQTASTPDTGTSGAAGSTQGPTTAGASLSPVAALGARIFVDTSLSGSGRMSCATCHDAALAHGSPFDAPVAPGGASLERSGLRKAPSIRYLRFNGPLRIAADGTASGGFFWDGRADTLEAQAKGPFLNPDEMANASVADVVSRLSRASYAAEFAQVFGADVFADPQVAFDRIASALAQFQREDPAFAPFSSKYDAFLAGTTALTPAELRGLALFNSAAKGNCAACHPSARGADGSPPLFTDFTYDALGLPRNAEIAANVNLAFNDLGLCARQPGLAQASPGLCGKFRVPSLRNVALAKRLFHNGWARTLDEAVRFYATRDTDARRWFPADATGEPVLYDDLPASLRGNVNVTEAPYNRRGGTPALNDAEIADLVAFLGTLTDGWQP